MLEELLFNGENANVNQLILGFEANQSDYTATNIRMMNAALFDDQNLKNWQESFNQYLQKHPEEC